MKKIIAVGLFLILSASNAGAQSDNMLEYDLFMEQVRENHPLSKKASLLVSSAEAAVLEAKGGFDPVLGFKRSDKNFTGIDYYDKNSASLTVPLPFGPDIYAATERAVGTYLDPEASRGTVSYIGVDIPLLKGLWMDERRASLRMATQYLKQSEQERLVAFNAVASAAAQSYWMWLETYQLWQITEGTLQLAQQRQNLLRTLQINGDRSEADTIEVAVQVGQLRLLRDERRNAHRNATVALTAHVWDEDIYDALITGKLVPAAKWQVFDETTIQVWLADTNPDSNPAMRWYDFKLAALGIEKKYKQQGLLPELNLSTRLLSKNFYEFKGIDQYYFADNYTMGISFKMPLFLRQGRGALQRTKLKMLETTLDRETKRRELTNKSTVLANDLMLINAQLADIANLIVSQTRLFNLETSRFNLGESSVFLVNTREQKLLELRGKQIELTAKKAMVLTKINELRAAF